MPFPPLARTRRSITALTATMAVLALLLSNCGTSGGPAGSGSSEPQDGGTLVVGLYTEPTAVDPQREYYWETFRAARNVYEPLVQEELSSNSGVTKLVPGLATAWRSSADGAVWAFDLRPGVKFHDGTEFDAAALDFNVKRFTGPYRWVERQANDHITLERFPDYWGTKPHLDKLVFRTIANNQSRLAAFQS